jgi:hypothetical protein
MARFNVNDKIEFRRFDKAIQKGIVIAGPFVVDKVDHYHVKWEWTEDKIEWKNMECDLISDLSSTKYSYHLSN